MNLPDRCRELLLSEQEPGEIYCLCLQELAGDSYALTETVVYGCEVRYALDVLGGKAPRLYNFGGLDGKGDRLLWSVLDALPQRKVAFLGSGPYPVTAFSRARPLSGQRSHLRRQSHCRISARPRCRRQTPTAYRLPLGRGPRPRL